MLQSIKKGWEHNRSVHLIRKILSAHLHALRLKFANLRPMDLLTSEPPLPAAQHWLCGPCAA